MSSETNPYEASQSLSSGQLTFPQKLMGVAVGALVVVASAITMSAFLFGILIALAGRFLPSPINFSALLESPLGRWLLPCLAGIIPISLMLGAYSMFRLLRVQRSLIDASARRQDLQRHLDAIRQSRLSP